MKREMTGRERVKAAIEFTGPDRMPHRHAYLPAVFDKYPEAISLLRLFPSDFSGEENIFIDKSRYTSGQWIDEWNCLWTVLKDGFSGQVTKHPLENIDNIGIYEWPSAKYANISRETEICRNHSDKYVLIGWITLFERMIDLRGFENLMADIAAGEPVLFEIRDRILKYNLDLIDRLLKLNPDCIALADDWGSQISLMISPKAWREIFLPAYKVMFERIRNSGRYVFFHTDGYTIDILPDLVEAGVNIFWVDLSVNGLERLKAQLAGKVCFQGLTDVQFIMKYGKPSDVETHAKRLINALGSNKGGFIACSELSPDQPWDNIKTVIETFHRQNT